MNEDTEKLLIKVGKNEFGLNWELDHLDKDMKDTTPLL